MAGQPAEDDLGHFPGGIAPAAGRYIKQERLAFSQAIMLLSPADG
jgi:hypothetical protein